jgi:superfamily II RNA helicase
MFLKETGFELPDFNTHSNATIIKRTDNIIVIDIKASGKTTVTSEPARMWSINIQHICKYST